MKERQNLNFFTQGSGVKVFKCVVGFSQIARSAKAGRETKILFILFCRKIRFRIAQTAHVVFGDKEEVLESLYFKTNNTK